MPPKIHHAVTLLESTASDAYAHPQHPNADAYTDPEYSWDDYIQSWRIQSKYVTVRSAQIPIKLDFMASEQTEKWLDC